MARTDMIAAYLERLAAEARVRGLDPERLVSEVADHLATASAREGQARALAAFGDAASIARDVACKRGVTMRITIRRAAAVLGIASAAAATVAHTVPSQNIDGTALEHAAVWSVGAMGVAATALVATARRGWAAGLIPAAGFGWVAVRMWSGPDLSELGQRGVRIGGYRFLAVVIASGAVVACAMRLARARGAFGGGLVAAGAVAVVLTAWWEPVGGFGDGQGNLALWLLDAGWLLVAGSLLPVGPGAGGVLRLAAGGLEHTGTWIADAGRRLNPSTE